MHVEHFFTKKKDCNKEYTCAKCNILFFTTESNVLAIVNYCL